MLRSFVYLRAMRAPRGAIGPSWHACDVPRCCFPSLIPCEPRAAAICVSRPRGRWHRRWPSTRVCASGGPAFRPSRIGDRWIFNHTAGWLPRRHTTRGATCSSLVEFREDSVIVGEVDSRPCGWRVAQCCGGRDSSGGSVPFYRPTSWLSRFTP